MKRLIKPYLIIALTVAGLAIVSSAWGQNLSWGLGGAGGAGTWDNGVTADWFNASSNVPWASNNVAIFGGIVGNVTVSGTIVGVNGLTFNTAGFSINGGAITFSGNAVNVPAGTTTIGTSLADTGNGMTKSGAGTLLLTASNNFSGSALIKAGTLIIDSGGSWNSTAGFNSIGVSAGDSGALTLRGTGTFTGSGDFNVGDNGSTVSPAVGTLTVSNTASLTVGKLFLGSAFSGAGSAATGTVNQSGGAVTTTGGGDGNLIVGGRNTGSVSGVGTYNLTGGSVSVNNGGNTWIGGYGAGTVNQSGGNLNIFSWLSIGRQIGSTGSYNLSGGSLTHSSSGSRVLVGENGRGTLTISGSGLLTTSGGLRIGNTSTGNGTVNLNGGTLAIPFIETSGGTSVLNFNGGTLKANASSAVFLQGLTSSNVLSGGAVLDDGGNNCTIAQALLNGGGGLTKLGVGLLTLNGNNTYTGSTIVSAGTLAVNNRITGPVAVSANATLAVGSGTVNVGSLTLSNNSTLSVLLGAPGNATNTLLQVNGNLTLAGQIGVTDVGGVTTNGTYPLIHYTGALTNYGITVSPTSDWNLQVDTSFTNYIRIIAVRKNALIEISGGDQPVNSLTTNLTAYLHGPYSGKAFWYEVRSNSLNGSMTDFGAHAPAKVWPFTARHLTAGTNYLVVYALNAGGGIQSNYVRLTLTLTTNSPVRPRPVPAEVWWGGLSDNTQMTNYSQWPFVQQFEDGYFFHSAGWDPTGTAALQNSLAANLRPFNTRYWPELGGGIDHPYVNSGHDQAAAWGGWAQACQNNGIIWSEFTHDYHMENMQAVCQVNPTWPTNNQIAWWTGDLSLADINYPYITGIWRDAFNDYYAAFPHIKVGQTSQPEFWPWDNYPAEVVNLLSFSVTNPATAFSINAHDIFGTFVNMAGAIGHPYFSLQSDAPWDYFGAWGDPVAAAVMRQKIRVYEQYLQSRGGRHTLICNVSNASTNNQGSVTAADNYYENSSLSSLYLHQQEGGRANRYLFESWYLGIPYAVVPETQAGTYTHLALSAIKYLKGIKDTNGTLEQLTLGVVSTGTTNQFSVTNNGDVACLPAIVATESGTGYLVARYYNNAGRDITAQMLSAEGYCHTNLLQPGQSTTFTIVVSALAGAAPTSTRIFTFEAFWNPQDPTGIVRSRKIISVTASNLASSLNPLTWYKLEGNANDSSGNGFNGIASGVSYVGGKVEAQAAQFNGTSSYIQIPRSISNDFTISFWLKTTDAGGTGQWWAGKGLVDGEVAGVANDFGTALVGPNIAFGVGNPDATITSSAEVNDGQWHHVAATRISSSGTMNLYVDGLWQASAPGPTGTRNSPPTLCLGSLQTGANFYAGTLDDVRLYGSSLNGAQVAALATLTLSNSAPVLSAINSRSVIAGQVLSVTNSASDVDAPPQTMTFALVSAPSGVTVNATNGILIWRPTIAQSPATNLISVQVFDNGTPSLGTTQSYLVTVLKPAMPTLSLPACSNGIFSFSVNGDSGPDYVLESSTNLANASAWLSLATNLSVTPPFYWADPLPGIFSQKFYRVRLRP